MVHLVFVDRPPSAEAEERQELVPAIVNYLHGGNTIGVTSFPHMSQPRSHTYLPHVDSLPDGYVGPAWKWPDIA